ncbi:DUF7344 domain-containing protein [Haloarcula salina]|uniref:DUF7344 domain-containing protein n=1 Tax=Haloarcula salina TaxID=1429914 RepID=UPI003C6F06BB
MSEALLDSSRARGGQDGNRGLTEEQVFEVLSNTRRRYVFHYLKQQQREVYLRELAERVSAWENEKPIPELTSAETKRVKTALHQHHLPKMDDAGFVRYDSIRETVELDDRVAGLQVYLDVVPGADIPWSLYYMGLGGVAVALSVVSWGNLWPLSGVSLAMAVSVALLLSAGVHTFLNYSRLRLGSTEEPPEVNRR